jgi:hypothetical protein
MDMSESEIDKRRRSALDVLARYQAEDPVERVQRLEKEVRELRGFETRVKSLLAQQRRVLNLLEQEIYDRERNGY